MLRNFTICFETLNFGVFVHNVINRQESKSTLKNLVLSRNCNNSHRYSVVPRISSKTKMDVFKFSDYDCIGFDLDNTLLKYNITNLTCLEYEVLAKYLVEQKGYNGEYLLKPLEDNDLDFMQKGLLFDFEKGNLLRISSDGMIQRACHGSTLMSLNEIKEVYPNQRWYATDIFCNDVIAAWNEPLSMKVRALLDYFDVPSSLIFARIVDDLDKKNGGPLNSYNIWPDILNGLIWMFSSEQFQLDKGDFFPALKNNREQYLRKCSPQTISWIKELKKSKITFLITGSNIDFVDFTASYALGKDWKSLFDIIVCNAKKPGFFINNRSFLSLVDYKEHSIVSSYELEKGGIYSYGNWKELLKFFIRISGKQNPCCLYMGDNLIQDVYVPKQYAQCDTVAVIEEQMSEGMLYQNLYHPDEKILNSMIWGSYFCLKSTGISVDSFWGHAIRKYSKICIPDLDTVAINPLEKVYSSFNKTESNYSGYHPALPLSISAF